MTPGANLPSDFDGCKRGFQYAPCRMPGGGAWVLFWLLVPSREWGNGMILHTIQYLYTVIMWIHVIDGYLWVIPALTSIDYIHEAPVSLGLLSQDAKMRNHIEKYLETLFTAWAVWAVWAAVIELKHVPLWLKSWWRRPIRVNDLPKPSYIKRNFFLVQPS